MVRNANEALRIASTFLGDKCKTPHRVQPDLTIERRVGWVVYWTLSTDAGEVVAAVGAAPILVDRVSGSARFTGTAYPIEWYLEAYEALGEAGFDRGDWKVFIRRVHCEDFVEGDPDDR